MVKLALSFVGEQMLALINIPNIVFLPRVLESFVFATTCFALDVLCQSSMNITGPSRCNCCNSQCKFLCCVSSALGRVLLHWSYGTCSGVRPCLDWRPRCTLTTRRVAGSRVLSDFYRYRFWLTPVASGIGQADGSVASRRHLGGVALGSAGSFDSAPY